MATHGSVTARFGELTLGELVFTVLFFLILGVLAIWMYSARTSGARMSEAIAGAGTIRSAARTYLATHGGTFPATPITLADLGFGPTDLDGKFSKQADYKFVPTPGSNSYTVTYTPSAAAAKLGMRKYMVNEPRSDADAHFPIGN